MIESESVEMNLRGEGDLPGHDIYTWNRTHYLSGVLAEKYVIQDGLPHPMGVLQVPAQSTYSLNVPSA